jgi:hypothetical protein
MLMRGHGHGRESIMGHYLQYFNVEKMGRFPNGADALLTTRMGVFTKLASVKEAKGSTIFVIAGLGKPKAYYLWEAFTIEDVAWDGEQYTPSGPGWVLLPPQLLKGKAFETFKAACANFVSFRQIDDLPYHKTLRKIADEYHLPEVTPACEAFCDELIHQVPKNGDAYYYRATVRARLKEAEGAREDFRKAVEVGTNFRHEAQLALQDKAAPAAAKEETAAGPKERIAEQAVARGRFARGGDGAARGDRKPFDLPDAVWEAIRQRRGQEAFRRKLLEAYGGRCAITGSDGDAALEVAYIVGTDETGPQEVPNGLLLRADVHTLFDLNLIRVHPRTRKIFVAEALKKGSYAKLIARQLRLPEKPEDRPSVEALQQRWDASGGAGA